MELNGNLSPGSNLNWFVGGGSLLVNNDFQSLLPTGVDGPGLLGGIGSVGSVNSGGIVKPGNPTQPFGALTIGAVYDAEPPAATWIEASSQLMKSEDALASGISSKLVVNGNASLSGTLFMSFDALPGVGTSYQVIDAGSVTGRFVRTASSPSSVFGDVSYTGTTVTYTVTLTTGVFRDGFE